MTVSQLFLQGRCHFADRGRNVQTSGRWGRPYPGPVSGRGGGWGAANQGYAKVILPPVFQNMGGAVGGWGAATQANANLIQPPVFQQTGGAGGLWGVTTQGNANLIQPPVFQQTGGAGGLWGVTTQGNANLIQPPVFQQTGGAGGLWGVTTQGNANLIQPPMFQQMGGAGGGWGAATQASANLIQPPVFQHMGIAGGGWGAAAQRNANVIHPAMFQHTGGAVGGWGAATHGNASLNQPPIFHHTAGAGGGWGAATLRNANPIQPPVFQHMGRAGGGWGAPAAVFQPPVFTNSTSGGSSDGGGLSGASGFGLPGNKSAAFSQNAFSALSSANRGDGHRDGQQRLLERIARDMATWESSGQWVFSCYSPVKGKANVSGFREFSPEEVRLEYYNCSANNITGYYINSVHQLVQQWGSRLRELKALHALRKASMQSQTTNAVTRPLPSLGFGGQQATSTGFPSFPVNSGSGATSFSFKANPSVPSGNAPALGSSAAAFNPPAFGVTSSPHVPRPVGFGNSSAPSAASFSFKTSGPFYMFRPLSLF